MATSLINTECKRYGCMKNLLACYANCRYNTRCDDLKNEVLDKTEQAAGDINKYLAERGRAPIEIHFLKRGLKFSTLSKLERSAAGKKSLSRLTVQTPQRPALRLKPSTNQTIPAVKKKHGAKTDKSQLHSALSSKLSSGLIDKVSIKKAGSKKRKKKKVMPKKQNRTVVSNQKESERALNVQPDLAASPETASKKTVSRRSRSNDAASRKRAPRSNGKLYIILEGKSASVVDEQELMRHLFANPSGGARYFEAKEVEARVQIVPK